MTQEHTKRSDTVVRCLCFLFHILFSALFHILFSETAHRAYSSYSQIAYPLNPCPKNVYKNTVCWVDSMCPIFFRKNELELLPMLVDNALKDDNVRDIFSIRIFSFWARNKYINLRLIGRLLFDFSSISWKMTSIMSNQMLLLTCWLIRSIYWRSKRK